VQQPPANQASPSACNGLPGDALPMVPAVEASCVAALLSSASMRARSRTGKSWCAGHCSILPSTEKSWPTNVALPASARVAAALAVPDTTRLRYVDNAPSAPSPRSPPCRNYPSGHPSMSMVHGTGTSPIAMGIRTCAGARGVRCFSRQRQTDKAIDGCRVPKSRICQLTVPAGHPDLRLLPSPHRRAPAGQSPAQRPTTH
jgi:hypothetical protein